MSRSSIDKNNKAKDSIIKAIGHYKDARSVITSSNETKRADEIVDLINRSISKLENAVGSISSVNTSISNALYAKAKAKEKEKEKEGKS